MRTTVQGPDGGYITVEHPDDASEDQIIAYAQANYAPKPLKLGKEGMAQAAKEVGETRNIVGKLGTGIGESGQRLVHGAKDLLTGYQLRTPEEKEAREIATATMKGAGPVAQGASMATDVLTGLAVPGAGMPARAMAGKEVFAKTLAANAALGAAGSPDSPLAGGALGAGGAALGTALPATMRMVQAQRMAPRVGASTSEGARLAKEAGTTTGELAERIERGVARGAEYDVPLTTSQAARSPELAGAELAARGRLPEEFAALTRRQNEAVYEAAQRGSRSAPRVESHAARRDELTGPMRERALADAGTDPWFATPVVQAVSDLSTGPTGVNPAVQAVAKYVNGQLGEGATAAMTPARLYEVRKVLASKLHGPLQIGDELSAATKGAERETLLMMKSIDSALDAASNGAWTPYLRQYGEASRPLENALASRMFRQELNRPGAALVGDVPQVTGRVLERAMAKANKSRFRESGRFDPRRAEELGGLGALLRENIEEPMRTAKLAGTGGGGSQTTMQQNQVAKALAADAAMATAGMVPGGATATAIGHSALKGVWKTEYARLLADPQRAVQSLRAAEASGRPLNPAEQAFASVVAQATRETVEGSR
jgi:hypothetical protein